MAKERTPKTTKLKRNARQVNREKALREKYQRERPTLGELLASGKFDEPMVQGDYWDLMETLERLRTLRLQAGLSLSAMTARSKIDRAALSRLESGINDNPTIATLHRYAHALGKRIVVQIVDAPEPVRTSTGGP